MEPRIQYAKTEDGVNVRLIRRVRTAVIAVAAGAAVAAIILLPPNPHGASANPLPDAVAVAAGGEHACALMLDGGVKCWGRNQVGQLGNGETSETSVANPVPVDVVGLNSVVAISAGIRHTCALTAGGGVKCWGHNFYGQLGDGQACDDTRCTTPVDVTGLSSGVTDIAVGPQHTCAITAAGGARCWGRNTVGELGFPTFELCGIDDCATEPLAVNGLSTGVTSISAGGFGACALTTLGGVKCWGRNTSGQLGDGTTLNTDIPVDVVGLGTGVTAISAGSGHSCALTDGGGIKCWGTNDRGQLGNETVGESHTPVNVCVPRTVLMPQTEGDWNVEPGGLIIGPLCIAVENMIAVAAGGKHTCAVERDSSDGPIVVSRLNVMCWGHNSHGQIGNGLGGEPDDVHLTPAGVQGLGGLPGGVVIAAAGNHTCAATTFLTLPGDITCWGDNEFGQLGDGTTTQRLTPVEVVSDGAKLTPTPTASETPTGMPTVAATSTATATQTTATPTTPSTATATPPPLAGDVDCSGTVNSIDAALILQLTAGLLESLPCPENGDVNGDGSITAVDAALVLQFSAGLLGSLPP